MRRFKRLVAAGAVALAVTVASVPAGASNGWECRMAKAADFQSPSQNTMCALEWLFELGW